MATVSKDRTGLFDGQVFMLTTQTGEALRDWLNTGIDYGAIKELYNLYLARYENDPEKAKAAMQALTEGKASKDWTEADIQALRTNLETEAVS